MIIELTWLKLMSHDSFIFPHHITSHTTQSNDAYNLSDLCSSAQFSILYNFTFNSSALYK